MMGSEAIFCLFVLALVFWGLVRNYASDALLLGALVLVTVAGIITPDEALVGFSDQPDGLWTGWVPVHGFRPGRIAPQYDSFGLCHNPHPLGLAVLTLIYGVTDA